MPTSASAGTSCVEEDALGAGRRARSTAVADLEQLLGRRAPVGRGGGDAGRHLVLQAGHPDLEELVEVLAEDGEELGPLEQRHVGVARPVASTRALKSSQESSRFR